MATASRTAARTLLRANKASSLRSLSSSASASSSASSSSSSAPSTSSTSQPWQPLLKPGTLPAYDEALAFLSSHSQLLRSKIASVDNDHPNLSADEKADLKESLEIAASINDPALLAQFQSSSATKYDAANAAFRHLRERVWRKDSGVLAKVIERCTLMHVFPDVLPAITPTVDVQVAFGEGSGYTDHQSNGGDVLVGAYVPVRDSMHVPKLDVNVFQTEPKKYTVALVDPDQPDEDNQSYKMLLLALKKDVQLSATGSPTIDLSQEMEVEYIPPHPQQGTPYHRYTTIVFEQSANTNSSELHINRDHFDLASFVAARALTPAGIHFWRAKWTQANADAVSKVYSDVLKLPQPKFTKPPSLDKVRKQVGDLGSKWFSSS